jgi:hypothetical protein
VSRIEQTRAEDSAGASKMKTFILGQLSTLELLVELMYGGHSGLVDDLKDSEPIPITELLKVLRVRSGQDVGDDFESWYQWFVRGDSGASAEEQSILENLFSFKQETDAIFRRIRDQRNEPSN